MNTFTRAHLYTFTHTPRAGGLGRHVPGGDGGGQHGPTHLNGRKTFIQYKGVLEGERKKHANHRHTMNCLILDPFHCHFFLLFSIIYCCTFPKFLLYTCFPLSTLPLSCCCIQLSRLYLLIISIGRDINQARVFNKGILISLRYFFR